MDIKLALSEANKIFMSIFQKIFLKAGILYVAVSLILFFLEKQYSIKNPTIVWLLVEFYLVVLLVGDIAKQINITSNAANKISEPLLISTTLGQQKTQRTFFTMSFRLILYTLLLIVPGIIFSIYWIFALYVSIFRDINGTDALKYSKKLVEGKWWRIFLLSVCWYVVFMMGTFLLVMITPDGVISEITTSIWLGLSKSYAIIVTILLFFQLDSSKKDIHAEKTFLPNKP
jgi:hypothetical protein